jgi:hypothetical protein
MSKENDNISKELRLGSIIGFFFFFFCNNSFDIMVAWQIGNGFLLVQFILFYLLL